MSHKIEENRGAAGNLEKHVENISSVKNSVRLFLHSRAAKKATVSGFLILKEKPRLTIGIKFSYESDCNISHRILIVLFAFGSLYSEAKGPE